MSDSDLKQSVEILKKKSSKKPTFIIEDSENHLSLKYIKNDMRRKSTIVRKNEEYK